MEEALVDEFKIGELMIDDIRQEVDVLQQLSSSLLVFDRKRKRLESHFNSLVDLIKTKQEAIRVEEEEAKARVERMKDERLEMQEKVFNSMIEVKMNELEEERKRVQSKVVEMEREMNEAKMDSDRMAVELFKKEREMRQLKIDGEGMAVELCEKKKEVKEMKNVVNDLTSRIREDARLGVTCKRLTSENFVLGEEVKSLKKELEKREKEFNDVLKVKMKKVAEDRERIERRVAEKEKGMHDAKMDKERIVLELYDKEKEVNRMKKTVADLTARIQEDSKTFKRLSDDNFLLQEDVKSLTKELEKHRKQSNDILKVKMKEVSEEREMVERQVAEKEKGMHEAKKDKERMVVELSEKEKEVNEMRKTVADLSARIQEDVRLDAVIQVLSDENSALQEEVKLLTKQLERKAHPLGEKEQLLTIQSFLQILASSGIITICDALKNPVISGEDLFKLAMEHIDDHEVATSTISSALRNAKNEVQDLVLEALRFSYIIEIEDHDNKSICRTCRILLLEQLCHICPQVAFQAREEARKVAVEWIAKLDVCADKFLELSRFLRFLSSYDVASEFEDEVLIPILYNVAIHEGSPDLCDALGFENRISGLVKTLLKSGQRLKALEYVSTFKLEKHYSVGKIVQDELNHINQTCHTMLKEGGQGQAPEIINFEINALRELIKQIKNLKCEGSKYTAVIVNIEQRLVKLEKMKDFKKRSSPDPSSSSGHEPSRKKICKFPETSKVRQSDPKDVVNVQPHIESRDICCSKSSSGSESLTMKEQNLTGTAKSTEVSPKDTLSILQESRSKDLCGSNSTSNRKPLSKEECQLATISQSIESASNGILNIHQESGHKALCCSNSSSDPKPSRKEESQLAEISELAEAASNDILNVHPESGHKAFCCPDSSNDSKPSRKEECQLAEISQPLEYASNGNLNVYPKDESGTLHCSNPKPSKMAESHLPGTIQSKISASNATRSVSTESGPRSQRHSNPSRISKRLKQRRKKRSKLSGTANPTKVVPKGTSNVNPRDGSVTLRPSRGNPKPANKTECESHRSTKSGSSIKQASNAFPDIGSRNAIQSQEMHGALTHFYPMQVPHGVISQYIFPSPHAMRYETHNFPPPQYIQPYPSFKETS